MTAAFISDGYTVEDVVIPPMDHHYPAVRFSYRPATLRELRTIDKAISSPATIDEAIDATCEFVARHLVRWDVTDVNGNAVQITAANVDRLDPVLAAMLFNITRGLYPEGMTMPPAATEDAPKNS